MTGKVRKHLTAYQEKWKLTLSFRSAFDSLTLITVHNLPPLQRPSNVFFLRHSGLLTDIKRIITFSLLSRGLKNNLSSAVATIKEATQS